MKILVLSDKPLWPGTSGGALAVLASVRGLGDNGAKVDVVSAETDKHRSTEISSVKNDSISGSYTTIRINTRINPFSLLLNLIFSNKPYNILRYRSGKFTSYLTYLLTKVDYDIIQIEGINMTVFIDLLRSKSKARISYRAHNVESEIWKGLASGERRHLIRIYYRILAQRLKKYESLLLGKLICLFQLARKTACTSINKMLTSQLLLVPLGSVLMKILLRLLTKKAVILYILEAWIGDPIRKAWYGLLIQSGER